MKWTLKTIRDGLNLAWLMLFLNVLVVTYGLVVFDIESSNILFSFSIFNLLALIVSVVSVISLVFVGAGLKVIFTSISRLLKNNQFKYDDQYS